MAIGIDAWWNVMGRNIIKIGGNKHISPQNICGNLHLQIKGHLLSLCCIFRTDMVKFKFLIYQL